MKSVLLAVGHGEQPSGVHDPGAVGGGWTEQTAGDIVVFHMVKRLSAISGLKVHHEANQKDPNFYGTVARANELDVDAVVSIHHDWTGGVSGVFGFWYPGSAQGERLTKDVVNGARQAKFKIADNWVKARGDLYLLRKTRMPATLIECGRIGEYTKSELGALGEAFAAGVAEYFGLDLPTPTPTQPSPTENEDDVKELVANIQKALIEAGYNLGDYEPLNEDFPPGADGVWGVKTGQAFAAALKNSGLTRTQADKLYVPRGTTVRIG